MLTPKRIREDACILINTRLLSVLRSPHCLGVSRGGNKKNLRPRTNSEPFPKDPAETGIVIHAIVFTVFFYPAFSFSKTRIKLFPLTLCLEILLQEVYRVFSV